MPGIPQRARAEFDPEQHREPLFALVREACELVLAAEQGGDAAAQLSGRLGQALRRHPKQGKGFFSRSELMAGFRAFAREIETPLSETRFVERMRLRPVRTQSGVTPVTSLK